jgi:hypothetical protein
MTSAGNEGEYAQLHWKKKIRLEIMRKDGECSDVFEVQCMGSRPHEQSQDRR